MAQKLMLVKPDVRFPVKKQGYSGDAGVPLGLLYLAGFVRQENGAEVSVKDYRLDKVLGRSINVARDISKVDIVGVGACTAEVPESYEVLREAKKMGKTTIMGGIFPSSNAKEVIRTGLVDFVVHGEGEKGLSALLKALDRKSRVEDVQGISFVRNGQIVTNKGTDMIRDLNTIPLPAYDLIDMQEYAKLSPAAIYAARGCPMACEFCTLNEFWEYKYRKRSFENIISELTKFKEAGFKRVHFKDETITLNKKWCNELFREIENADLGMSYKVKSRADGIDEQSLQQMMRAGVDTIHMGAESITPQSLKSMSKGVGVRTIDQAFDLLLNNGCQINPVYLFGWVGEKPEDLELNASYIEARGQRKGVITYVSFITPHPGSHLVKKHINDFVVLSNDYSRYTHKQPVAVPKSLGDNGLQLMVDAYHRIGEICNMQSVNPRIEQSYLESLTDSSSLTERGHEEKAVYA